MEKRETLQRITKRIQTPLFTSPHHKPSKNTSAQHLTNHNPAHNASYLTLHELRIHPACLSQKSHASSTLLSKYSENFPPALIAVVVRYHPLSYGRPPSTDPGPQTEEPGRSVQPLSFSDAPFPPQPTTPGRRLWALFQQLLANQVHEVTKNLTRPRPVVSSRDEAPGTQQGWTRPCSTIRLAMRGRSVSAEQYASYCSLQTKQGLCHFFEANN